MEVVNTRECTQVKNHLSVISVSTHPINLDVGMSISKNKDESCASYKLSSMVSIGQTCQLPWQKRWSNWRGKLLQPSGETIVSCLMAGGGGVQSVSSLSGVRDSVSLSCTLVHSIRRLWW